MALALPAILIAAAYLLLALGVEPVPTWFYVFAWYPTLVLLDGIATRLDGRPSLLARPRTALSLLGWSTIVWLVFEAANLRLQNWYYVSLPRALPERWAGILVSFATVVPAVILAERALDAAGIGHRWRPRRLRLGVRHVRWYVLAGIAGTAAVLAWPAWLYPLIWGTVLLVCDPLVYQRRRELSLLADVERGEWGRVARLMLGGLGIGFLWETYNHWARGKWIYTVPLFEDFKWFEMPPLGFVGFPFFALEAWAMYHALTLVSAGSAPRRRGILIGASAAFAITVLAAMDRWTVSSTVPPPTVFAQAGTNTRAQLATLRGIGTEHAATLEVVGVASVCALAAQEPVGLWSRIDAVREPHGRHPTPAEVRVWVRAARGACEVAH